MTLSRCFGQMLPIALLALGLAACDSASLDSSSTDTTLAPPADAQGFVILESPETIGWPSYFIPDPAFSTDEGEMLILFWRDPACIPADFNLIEPPGFAPNAGACPSTLHAKEWWLPEDLAASGGPWGTPCCGDDFRVPVRARYTGDDVPAWVVDLNDFLATFDDGVLTIGELASLDRIEGTATELLWVPQNSNRATSTPSQRPNHSVYRGRGELEDGRSFRFHLQERQGAYNHIEVVIQ